MFSAARDVSLVRLGVKEVEWIAETLSASPRQRDKDIDVQRCAYRATHSALQFLEQRGDWRSIRRSAQEDRHW